MPRIEKSRIDRKKRQVIPTILFVCEGTKTETLYFAALKDLYQRKINIKIPQNNKTSPEHLVRYAEFLKNKDYCDYLYVVFDLDNNTQVKLNEAKSLAENITEIILSNPCFEIWYLLHFEKTTRPFTKQSEVETNLKRYIPKYEKNKCIFNIIGDKIDKAIENAESLELFHNENNTALYSIDSRPYTAVYKIIKKINELVNNN